MDETREQAEQVWMKAERAYMGGRLSSLDIRKAKQAAVNVIADALAEKDREIERWKKRAARLEERSYNDGYTAGLAAGGDFLTKVGRDDLKYRLLTECRPGR